jgi:hypothetical protein
MLKIVLLFVISLIYSIVRYVVFAPRNLEHIPVFITNKAIAMSAALCFAVAFGLQWRAKGQPDSAATSEANLWFRAGIYAALLHVPLTLAILRPSYFKEFYSGDRLSFHGETLVLFGGLTLATIYLVTRANVTAIQRWWLSLLFLTTLFLHTLFMGLARGVNMNASHAYLPPMWLLSLLGIALGICFLLLARPIQRE